MMDSVAVTVPAVTSVNGKTSAPLVVKRAVKLSVSGVGVVGVVGTVGLQDVARARAQTAVTRLKTDRGMQGPQGAVLGRSSPGRPLEEQSACRKADGLLV